MSQMRYCLHPSHRLGRDIPWFIAKGDEQKCPKHQERPKARVRWVDGEWRVVE